MYPPEVRPVYRPIVGLCYMPAYTVIIFPSSTLHHCLLFLEDIPLWASLNAVFEAALEGAAAAPHASTNLSAVSLAHQ